MVYHIAPERPGEFTENPLTEVDGDFAAIKPADEAQDGGRRISPSTFTNGRAVDQTVMPSRLKRGGDPNQPLFDLEFGPKGAMLVSAKVRDVVERFEPGVHQFFPMSIEQGGTPVGELFLFVICNRLDALNREACVPEPQPGRLYMPNYDDNDRMVFDVDKVGDHHAWHDMFAVGTFVSDSLFDALQEAGVSGLTFTRFDQA